MTEGSVMKISFTRSKQEKQHPANFTLIYSSFHGGACEGPEGVGCSIRNSSKLKDACFDSEYICKRFNDVVCSVQHKPGKSSKIIQYLLCGLLGIAVLFALKFFYHQYKKGEDAEEEDVIGGTCQQNIKTRLTQILHLQNVQTSERIDTTDLELSSSTPSIADINYYMNDNQGTHTDISSLEFETGPPVRPSAPVLEQCDTLAPPYEETPVPSYSEVMSHQDKYIVH
ncbi:uncharacterized protein LOC132745175 [Ruditapes philippinarum]|uniref:uncharacterized protein LOC132745175 n=1 Tax=Ruditapes philippinarum TaxID=129788 RepID=UPI00295AF6FD|nr:uncharacterized protein LOC132745175 [Ruditapes philippinarum]XP_060589987.1 uncharacterized protein LOC132745175 [Ruditapes philippinarum]